MKTPDFFKRSELMAALWLFRREFVIVGVLSMVANLLLLSPTMYMLQVYDRVLHSGSELTLVALSLITLFLFMVMGFADWMRTKVLVYAGLRFDKQLSTRVFNASFDSNLNPSGTAPPRAFGDLLQVRQFLTGSGIFAFFDLPWTPVYIAVLFILHPWLGIMAIGFALVQGALAWWGHRSASAPSELASKAASDDAAYLQSKLRNAETLESMGMVGNLAKHWRGKHHTSVNANSHAHDVSHRIVAVSKFVRYTQQSLALGMGGLLVIDGQLSAGAMIAANVLTSRALAPIDTMVGLWRTVISSKAAFLRLEALLLQFPERDAALKRVDPRGLLTLQGVVATAAGRTEPILRGIDLQAQPGSVTVVLGPSGSGKSTLARVMVGIWPEVAGNVLLDGLPLQGWDRMELGPHIGYLPQDIELFEGSIAENISRFAQLDSNKVIEAAQSAGLHNMILRLPKGYDTPMGEAGGLLSGGQRQRIALARAVYGSPALVVLDEPNANLDDPGEAALMKTVRELKDKGKTVVLITHRPSAIGLADQLIYLQDGRIKFEGPRDVVLAALLKARTQSERPVATDSNVAPA